MSTPVYIGCDFNARYRGAQDAVSLAYLNTGTCTYSLQSLDGTILDSGSLAYVAASNGDYLGVIDAAVTALLTVGASYKLVITFVQGNYDDKQVLTLWANYRGS